MANRPVMRGAGYPGFARRASPGLPFGIAVIFLAVVLGVAGAARAENECGRPEAGTPIVCSPSNYDAATEGNIVYHPGEANEGDFSIRLADDLSIRYDRHAPDDDLLMFPVSGDPLYSAVRIETDADHAGDISFFSSADVTSNGRGISVGHYGRSGALCTEIAGAPSRSRANGQALSPSTAIVATLIGPAMGPAATTMSSSATLSSIWTDLGAASSESRAARET